MDMVFPSDTVEVFEEYEDGQWRDSSCGSSQALNDTGDILTTVLFARGDQLRDLFQTQESTPPREKFLNVTKRDIIGSFYCNFEGSSTQELTLHTSWTIYKIKEVKSNEQYRWLQHGVFVEWDITTGRQMVLFINIYPALWSMLKSTVRARSASVRGAAPFLWHLLLVEECAHLYDTSFWLLRNLVRSGEKIRPSRLSQSPDFGLLHDTARHIFHHKETIELAEYTVQNLILEIGRWTDNYPEVAHAHAICWAQIQQDLRLVEKEMFSCKLRSRGLWERQDNEINYALNITGQLALRDSIALKQDSAAMKTIAALSLVYLPGSFVSTVGTQGLFGTNFFNLSKEDSGQTWLVSENFWLYWLITIPLTALTIMFWTYPGAARELAESVINLVNYAVMKMRLLKLKRSSNDKGYLQRSEVV
ncbi:hypothetical protein BDV10DRAFT_181175 [Aspergillus recurvatus]